MAAHSMDLFLTSDQIAMWQFLLEMALNRVGKKGSNLYAAAQYGNQVQFAVERSDLIDYLVYFYAFKPAKKKAVSPELQFLVATKEARQRNMVIECNDLDPLFGATMFKILDNSWTGYPVNNYGFNPLMRTSHLASDHRGIRRETPIRMHGYFLKEYMKFKFKQPFPHVFKELEGAIPKLKELFPNYNPDTLIWRSNDLAVNWNMYYVPFDIHYVTRLRLESGVMYIYNEKSKKIQISIPYRLLWRVVMEYDMVASPMHIVIDDENTSQMYQAIIDKGLVPQMIFNF